MEPKDIIKKAREAKKLTQSQLAENVGVSERMIQRYEEGKFPKFKSTKVKKLDGILGTQIYDKLYDRKSDTIKDSDNEYLERLIEEIEARRSDAEATAIKMESHYNDMKNALERAQVTINEILKPIKDQTQEILSSSKKVQEGLHALKTEIVAEHGEMMETMDQIAGNEPGTTASKAGNLEIAHRIQRTKRGKNADTDKHD